MLYWVWKYLGACIHIVCIFWTNLRSSMLLSFSRQVVSDSFRSHGLQLAGPPCPSPSPRVCPSSCPLNWWYHPTISSSSPAFNLPQHQSLFQWVKCSYQVTKVLELKFQHQSFQWVFRIDFLEDWLVWSPCFPRNSQETSPAPQFERINS